MDGTTCTTSYQNDLLLSLAQVVEQNDLNHKSRKLDFRVSNQV